MQNVDIRSFIKNLIENVRSQTCNVYKEMYTYARGQRLLFDEHFSVNICKFRVQFFHDLDTDSYENLHIY